MGEDASQRKTEVAALRAGIELGLTLIDTAEMYADGGAEKVVGEALTGLREKVFLVSKVYPWNAGGQKAINACEASLRRLNTDYLDLYLLHWSGSFAFEETVAAMEKLIAQGKSAAGAFLTLIMLICRNSGSCRGNQCATNQVLYHLGSRGIEYDLLLVPATADAGDGLQSVSPGRAVAQWTVKNAVVNEIAHAHNISAAQVLLAWVISHQGVMAIPKVPRLPMSNKMRLCLRSNFLQRN